MKNRMRNAFFSFGYRAGLIKLQICQMITGLAAMIAAIRATLNLVTSASDMAV